MEMRRRHSDLLKLMRRAAFLVLLSCFIQAGQAQYIKRYTILDGNMFITLGKNLPEASLDSFITQFELSHLALKRFIETGFTDSIRMNGWDIVMDNKSGFMITKPLESFNEINNSADRIVFMGKNPPFNAQFPSVSSSILYGYNRFRNQPPFAIRDSMVSFHFRENGNFRKVMLAGSFNQWDPNSLPMVQTDSGWVLNVKLKPGKYWYKFIADGNWREDRANRLSENDGLGNINSVFYVSNQLFKLEGFNNAKKVTLTGSFNRWNENEIQLEKTGSGWELPLYLADGTHSYRFKVDGKWITDPANPDKLPNEFNDFNSVVRKGPSWLFRLNGYPDANTVFLSGSFNNWRRDELMMYKVKDGWELPYVLGAGNYEYVFIVDGKAIPDPAAIATRDKKSSTLVLNPNHSFHLKGFENAKEIYLAGDFNNWARGSLPMVKQNGEWVVSLHLSPGKHLYKFIVDDKWIRDPNNKLFEENEHGTGNSVIWIE